MKTDRLTSAVLKFEKGTSTFTCSTQLIDHRHVELFGTKGRIEMITPFVPSPESKAKIIHQIGSKTKEIIIDPCNQYTIQGDLYSQAIINDSNVPTPIKDAVANMKVIDKIMESHKKGIWVKI